MPIDFMPIIYPFIRLAALLLVALVVGVFAAAYVNHRMRLMEYPDSQRRKWRTLAFEASSLFIAVLGAIVVYLPTP
ncbi:hypothetical protein BUE93_20825 [Chromobacterium amazonense]|uniref:Uncharacterized protein n=1 Tax=Chromobacterium amazonense TaxID=1382803 RepID=A0A2S9WZ13_9NEIS|nr:hypothetical protein [Chromobacterium amazonense]PRP68712.1 hypothetical protein BUE93_20825 [Chromobacterium amazonense]